MNAHVFRDSDGQNHVVLSAANRVSRRANPSHRALCARRITPDMTRRLTTDAGRIQAPVTCDSCLRSFTGFVDVVDTDFGFPRVPDGTGRFE